MRQAAKGFRVEDPKIVRFLLTNPASAGLWLAARFFLGWQWFDAGRHKVVDPAWMETGAALQRFWERAIAVPKQGRPLIHYGWYRDFLEFMLDRGWHVWFAQLVAVAELAIGVALILGAFTGIAAFFGATMNFNFMLAGTASANPLMFAVAMAVVMAWKVAGYWGLDRWLLTALGTPWHAGALLQRPSGEVLSKDEHPEERDREVLHR